MIKAEINYFDLYDVRGGLEGIYNSIGHPPIVDVQLSSSCSHGYTPYDLETWPGTINFCYDFGTIRTNYNRSMCFNEYLYVSNQTYRNWLENRVCVKRASAFRNGTTSCPTGYIKCYSGLCISGNQCPITFAEISSTPRNYSDGSSTLLSNGRYFNIRRQADRPGIGTFSFNIG